ncbi:MAG TPA: GGDEF domain-containing protein [Woeseiaceae bacterium]|nr:GGDEF domain-containing protein [Woeseiaceae bacterium]
MITVPRPELLAIPDSLYAAELQRDALNHRFSPELEAEYVSVRLLDNRSLIRVTCVFVTLLALARGAEQAIGGSWNPNFLVHVGLVVLPSIALAWIALGPAFASAYLPFARVLVPVRNAMAAVPIAGAAAHGEPELLMILPLMVLGPFFFVGLRYREALFSALLTATSFIFSAFVFDLALPLALRACTLLLLVLGACAIAARRLETWSRTSFLKGRVIAELAQHDALTGTKNRRVFDEHLKHLWPHAIESGRPIAILLIDVDHFKAYNDRYGHQAGDRALRRIAQTLQRFASCPLDVLARYGGEEFAAILYDMDARKAQDTAERMRRAVSDLDIEHRESRTSAAVTISVGVAAIEPSTGRAPRGALQLADQALYQAKRRGRNRVELLNEADYSVLVTGVFSKDAFG